MSVNGPLVTFPLDVNRYSGPQLKNPSLPGLRFFLSSLNAGDNVGCHLTLCLDDTVKTGVLIFSESNFALLPALPIARRVYPPPILLSQLQRALPAVA